MGVTDEFHGRGIDSAVVARQVEQFGTAALRGNYDGFEQSLGVDGLGRSDGSGKKSNAGENAAIQHWH